MRVRQVKTGSGKYALQVVSKRLGKLTVHKHIGSYQTEQEKEILREKAHEYIQRSTGQLNLLEQINAVSLSDIVITRSRPVFAYWLLSSVYDRLGFSRYPDLLIKDLIIARLYQPASKARLQEAIYESLDRYYGQRTIYRHLKEMLNKGVKEQFQQALIGFAKLKFKDPLRLVFYDVTTLYFESQVKTDLKDFGFSKDHRATETQVVIGLVVNKDGFPLYFDIFAGSTFEGHTLIPVVQGIKKLLKARKLIVIADAAMISKDNIEKLADAKIFFIVGARLANIPEKLIDSIAITLNKTDGKIITQNYREQRLVCQYSQKRANKDKSDREKQLKKAREAISAPSKITQRFKFVKTEGRKPVLNTKLVTKAKKLEGIKGYLTNTDLSEQTIIDRYHDLWHVEKSFRITKSDLEARPIFHRLSETIKAHLIIVFAGLAISKYLEIKTGMSIERILRIANKVLTHTIINSKTGESAEKETTIEDPMLKQLVESLRAVGN